MTTKHSLFTRGLALLLAMILVISNMSGLTITAKAAESTLFDVIADSVSSTDALNKILANPAALPKLAEKNVAVDVPEVPDDAAYQFVNGKLELNAVDAWVPMFYNVGEGNVAYTGAAEIPEGTEYVSVVYYNEVADMTAVQDYITNIAGYVNNQRTELNNVSTPKSITALSMLDYDFIEEMIDEVQNLTVEDLGIEAPTPEDFDIDVDYLVANGYIDAVTYFDYDNDGDQDADDKAAIDAEIMADPAYTKAINDAIDNAIAEELAETKAEYVAILGKLMDRLVEGDNLYMEYLDRKGRPEYEDFLIVFAMLSEYDEQGLYHYYQNAEYINGELKALSSVLYEILGEPTQTGYENDKVVDALLTKMDYIQDVNASQLAAMADRMKNAATNLPKYMDVLAEINMADKAAVDHLFFAKNSTDLPLISQSVYNADNASSAFFAEEFILEVPQVEIPEETTKPVEGGCAHANLAHFDTVAPACHYEGNIEYWVCYDCECVWQNEALTQLTNIKRVILPALGGEVVHVEAVTPGCENEGNIEHWYCESCEQVWQNAELTQLTNHKNVILPVTHQNVVHVDAVAPSVETEGNIEYWYCADCLIVWADEAQTQVTNFKNVILPKAPGNTVDTAIEVSFQWNEDGISATATLTVEPGNWYFCAYRIAGMELTINGQSAKLTSGMGPWAPSTFMISNNGTEAAEYVVEISYPVGSMMNPEAIWDISDVKVSLAEGNEQGYYLTYTNYRVVGELSFDVSCATAGAEVDVILTNMTTYELAWLSDSNDGTVSIAMNPGDQINIQVAVMPDANWVYPAADVTLKGDIVFPVGSMMNPAALVDGVNNAQGSDQGYFYAWTAQADGTLVLTMPEGNWSYTVNNMTSYIYGDTQWSDSDPVVNPAYVFVNKGDELQIIVNTYDPANPWAAPAETLSFNAEFKKPVQLSFKVDGGAVASVSTYKVGYALTEADAAKHAEALAKKATGMKVFDKEAFLAEYTGYVVTAKEIVDIELKYAITVDGKEVLVSAKDNMITMAELGFETDGNFTLVVNGTEILVNGLNEEFEIDTENANVIVVKEFVSRNRLNMLALADQLNAAGNAGYYEVVTGENGEDVLVCNMALSQFGNFGAALFEADLDGVNNAYLPVQLNGNNFIYGSNVTVDMSAVVTALLEDAEFSSEALIAIGEAGMGELLHATMTTPHFEGGYVLNLTSTPEEMAKVAKALKAARGHFWFTAGEGFLDVSVNVPEEAYEAYTAYALLTGRMTKEEITDVKNMNGLAYVENFMNMLQNEKVTAKTYANTLRMLGVNKNIEKYETAYNYLKNFITDDAKFTYSLDEKTSTVMVNMDVVADQGLDLDKLVKALLGTSIEELGQGRIATDDTILTDTHITFVNEIPSFGAIVIDPARLNDAGKYAKAQAVDLCKNLATENIQGPAAVMLLKDVYGDVTFDDVTVLDLNGKTIHGNVKSNKALIIMDSSIDTVSGGGVTGTVSGNNVAILSGTYGSNVEARLQDGYFQDANGAVKHALFTVESGKILVDSGLYRSNVDGLLPAVHCIAADIVVDTLLNYYFTGALYAEGKSGNMGKLYDVNFTDLVYMISANDAGYIFDEILDLVNVDALSDFNNKIIADLLNIDKIAASLNNGGTIASYNFQLRPWDGTFRHETDGDYFTVDIQPSASRARKFNLSLGLDLPTGADVTLESIDKTISIQDLLDELARIVVTTEDVDADYTELELNLYQPVRNGKLITIGGDATATLNLDFSHNTNYNRILGAALAYFDEDLTMDLVKNGCIVDLNEAMHDITIGQLFDTINKVVQNNEIPFKKIAAKLDLDLSKAELAKLEKVYDLFQQGAAKVMNKFDLADIAATPLSDLVDNDGRLVFDADLKPHYADAFYKGFGVAAKVGYTDVKVILTFANDHQPGEPVREDICNCSYDMVVYCELCGIELSREHVRGLWGDVNCDGLVDARDSAWIAKYEVGLVTADQMVHFDRADVNNDGFVDARDSAWIAKCEVGIVNYEDFPAVKAENA